MTRTVGTVVRGIRTPIIKEDTNLADVVVNSIMEAQKEEGFTFHDRDIIAITEAVVGISEGNFIKVDDIAYDKYLLWRLKWQIWRSWNSLSYT